MVRLPTYSRAELTPPTPHHDAEPNLSLARLFLDKMGRAGSNYFYSYVVAGVISSPPPSGGPG